MLWLISCVLLAGATAAGAAFEIVGIGARARALGSAFSAGVDDAGAAWFNPAANGRIKKFQVGTTHALLYPGLEETLSLNGLAVAAPVGRGGIQLGLSTLNFPGWREQVGVLGYGRGVHPRFSVGGNLRSRGWKTTGLSHRSWSVDLGGIYEVGWIGSHAYLRLGWVLSNINRANDSEGGYAAGKTPRGMILAGSLQMGSQEILIDIERRGGVTEMRVGYEAKSHSLGGAAFRVGANSFSSDWEAGELNAGLGHSWKQWHLDYVYTYPLRVTGLGGMHGFSISYRRR